MDYIDILNNLDGVFSFAYKSGRGHFSVNIENFLEIASSRDFKNFLDIVNLSSDPFQVVSDFQKIIVAKIEDERGFYQGKNQEKLINKLCGFLAQIEKAYGIACEEKEPEKIHVKKADVLTIWNENGEKVVKCLSGFKFSKFGYNCYIYKYCKNHWIVILSCCALQISSGKTKDDAISNFDEKIADVLSQKEKRDIMRTAGKEFFNLVQESNFLHLFDADFCAIPEESTGEESKKEEAAVMPSTEKEACATVENTTKKEESAMVAECLQVAKEPGKPYNRIEKIFSILKRTQRQYKRIYISIVHFHAFQNKTPRNAIKTARNAIVLCPCLLDFSKNGKWIMENADFSHTGLFTTVSPRFSVGYSTGKSPPGGYQKFLPYFENKNGGIGYG